MSWYNKALKYGVRAGTAIASGGASEAYRAATGKADPVTSQGEKLVDRATQEKPETSGPTAQETPEEKARREQLQANADADLDAARRARDRLTGEPTPLPRDAPQVTAPGAITPVQAGAPTKVASTFDTTDADEGRAAYQAYIEKQKAIAEGRAGPSAAELAMRRGNAEAIAGQRSLAAGTRGYSQSGVRALGRNIATLQQQNVAQTGELRAQEAAAANERLGNAIATGRGQDITVATAKGAQELDAARSNQAAQLQTTLANAGWSNEAILKMSDQELQARLANAGYQLTQQQLDDLRVKSQRDQQLQANRDVLAGSQAAAGSAEERRARLQQLQQMQDEARRRGDAAGEQMLATIITSYLTN